MTHDELLARLDAAPNSDSCWKIAIIRKVVELHEPGDYGHDSWQACLHCSCQDCHTFIVYPCPTIQAIEKELA